MKKYRIDWAEEMLFEVLQDGTEKEVQAYPSYPPEFADYSEAHTEIERLKAENEVLRIRLREISIIATGKTNYWEAPNLHKKQLQVFDSEMNYLFNYYFPDS